MEMQEIVSHFARALKQVDADAPREPDKPYKAGIGPLKENTLVRLISEKMHQSSPTTFKELTSIAYPGLRNRCDLSINQEWVFEIKLARPFGDNGKEAENWSMNVLHPYAGNASAIGDCLKLKNSSFESRKGIVIIGYEHSTPILPLEPAIRGFELLAANVANITLSTRISERVSGLIHPVHQAAILYGWEILG